MCPGFATTFWLYSRFLWLPSLLMSLPLSTCHLFLFSLALTVFFYQIETKCLYGVLNLNSVGLDHTEMYTCFSHMPAFYLLEKLCWLPIIPHSYGQLVFFLFVNKDSQLYKPFFLHFWNLFMILALKMMAICCILMQAMLLRHSLSFLLGLALPCTGEANKS